MIEINVEIALRGSEIYASEPDGKHEFVAGGNGYLRKSGIIVIDGSQLWADDVIVEGVKSKVGEDAYKQGDHDYGDDSSSERTVRLVVPVALKGTMSEDIAFQYDILEYLHVFLVCSQSLKYQFRWNEPYQA